MKQWAKPNGCMWIWLGMMAFSLVVWCFIVKCTMWLFKLIF